MLVGLLKFIFFLLLAYYFFVFFSRFILAFFLKRWINKMKNNIHVQKNKTNYKEHETAETVVQYEKDDNIDPGGEYVDFEDLDNE